MAVPRFHEFTLPILRHLAAGEARHWRELREVCISEFGLSEQDCLEATPGGGTRLDTRGAACLEEDLLVRPTPPAPPGEETPA